MLLPPQAQPHRLAARPPVSVIHMTVDLQAKLDDPASGGEWDWPLRLIARWHCAIDVFAPVLFRVNRQFEYCWRLAVKTNAIDLKAHRLRLLAQPALPPMRSIPKKDEHVTPVFLLSETDSRRKTGQDMWMMRGFEVTRSTNSLSNQTLGASKNAWVTQKVVTYSGPTDVHVPADAVIQGAGAVDGQ